MPGLSGMTDTEKGILAKAIKSGKEQVNFLRQQHRQQEQDSQTEDQNKS